MPMIAKRLLATLAALACAFAVFAADAVDAVTLTVKTSFVGGAAWIDLGPGPLQISARGQAAYAISDAVPALAPGDGVLVPEAPYAVCTASHVWVSASSSFGVTIFSAPLAC